jgi:hypothetical protein
LLEDEGHRIFLDFGFPYKKYKLSYAIIILVSQSIFSYPCLVLTPDGSRHEPSELDHACSIDLIYAYVLE